ncbi:taurine dioxygenase [Zavarzinia sp. CC-PAN008]|uniref:taurine dioxygenase n=1 Tax=Zavarzinia sp. CC-PAN008 TaxID=3243332 RepID=UPI003F745E3F
MTLALDPVSPSLGVVVRGLDVAAPPSPEAQSRLRQALVRHQVLFFEDQDISPAQHRDFAALFGPLLPHPIYQHVPGIPEIIVLETGANRRQDSDVWHADMTFTAAPPLGSALLAVTVPDVGGDTMWANMVAAYRALSPAMQVFLDGLHAVHDLDMPRGFPRPRDATPEEDARWQAARRANPPVRHPVVRTIPETGERCLFVNESFTREIEGLTGTESDAVLRFLFAHVQRPEFACRWKWRPGSLAIWDNRSTLHYALADYGTNRRVMHRATIQGDRPA